MKIEQVHQVIKSKLANRTNEQLISDAKVARANKSDESQRMVFALIMDVLSERISENEFDEIYNEITNI
jgi:hypothetical protein